MTPKEYQQQAKRTECDQLGAMDRMHRLRNIRLNHSIVGMINELGEISSLLQKQVYYGHAVEDGRWLDEYGDLLWHFVQGLNALGLTLEKVMVANLNKLKIRYPELFDQELAKDENRNRQLEQAAQVYAE